MTKTSMNLREMLFEEMESLRAGKSDANRANAVAKLAAQIVGSAKLDLDYSRTGGEGAPVAMYSLTLEEKEE